MSNVFVPRNIEERKKKQKEEDKKILNDVLNNYYYPKFKNKFNSYIVLHDSEKKRDGIFFLKDKEINGFFYEFLYEFLYSYSIGSIFLCSDPVVFNSEIDAMKAVMWARRDRNFIHKIISNFKWQYAKLNKKAPKDFTFRHYEIITIKEWFEIIQEF